MKTPVIKIGDVTGAIYQPERPVHFNPDGSAQGTLTYKCANTSQFATVPAYLTAHPFIPNLKCYESELDVEPGLIYRITSIYKGVLADNPEALAQHDFARTTTEAPIETHPLFAVPYENPPVTPSELAKIELALQNAQDPSGLTKAGTLLYNKKRRGIESFLKPGAVYKKTYVSNNYPSGTLMGRVGKIHSPESPAPSAPTGQNYLCIGISWNKQAGVVTIMEEYQLSGVGGWDPDLYKA